LTFKYIFNLDNYAESTTIEPRSIWLLGTKHTLEIKSILEPISHALLSYLRLYEHL